MANFFKFTDLIKLASMKALKIPKEDWSKFSRVWMGRTGAFKLENLQNVRLDGLKEILFFNMEMITDLHSEKCVKRNMIEKVWKGKVNDVLENGLKVDSELLELLNVDLRGGHCGECLVLLGETIQKCLLAARELPKSL